VAGLWEWTGQEKHLFGGGGLRVAERPVGARLFSVVTPSPDDVARAAALPLTACPRRYCWWWQSLGFDWDTPVAAGCTFLASNKPPGWPDPQTPCCRAVPGSEADQHEPREPHLQDDGFDDRRFCAPACGPDAAPGTLGGAK
jgi:hypothetical protein